MKIIDTHSHIYADEFKHDIGDAITRAKQVGVEKILLPNIDSSTIGQLHLLADNYPNYCIPMMGLHPTSVGENWEEELAILKEQFSKRSYIAVGEIGIDLYWDKKYEEQQKEAFEEQLRWSIEYNLPVAIHSRDAICECIESIKKVGSDKLRGVFHSFGGTTEELKEILALQNFMLGINGVVTFKNSSLSTVLKETDLSHIIVETDSPYLSPIPYRGKRNESSYTIKVVERLAEIYGISPEEVGNITTENAKRLFRIEN
ncbi:TatD family hydrolase [Dysgonomonas sp. ZJ709]|uniref:TatD family hydrolase n=1 Tax=Dysgonomonas sp. ZJ709 TaxID=2709797 RepID=UPI0013E9A379|nr:TatD family hydrolase [Dysgonomonas sp. ZJ709]